MLDFTNVPVIDAHSHPFTPSREKKNYISVYGMCIYPEPAENFSYLTSYHMALKELRRFFNLPDETPDQEVIATRQRAAKANYKEYVRKLYQDAGMKAMIMDFGFPIIGEGFSDEEFQTFYDTVDGICDVYDMIRIETTCDRYLYREGMTFDEMVEAFDKYVERHMKERKTVCIKSVVGYYTGVKWEPVSHDEAEKNFYECYRGQFNIKRTEKKFRDYMVYHGLELAVQNHLNFQIHTGAGDPPKCDLRLINPSDLYDLINTDLAKQTKFEICHAGFPYSYEAAFLVANYPHVYTNISSTRIYAGRSEENEFRHVLDMCPHNKILYGADGGGDVDMSWYATCYFKRYFTEILQDYVDRRYFSEAYAQEIGEMILHKNAERLYQIK